MNLLLDTHALLWFLAGDYRLSKAALSAIQNPTHTVFVSAASLWEISIKDSLGKLILPQPFDQLFPARLELSGILVLPILIHHLHQHRRLELHHSDPFDRLIIAQSIADDLTLLSCDSQFSRYDVRLLW